jgi:prepilin-type N-terminal cleavage/methylation domain-containing protein
MIKQAGFTLLELLVAMTIGLVISGIIVSITTVGLKSAQVSNQQARLHSDALYVTDILASWMKQAQGFTVTGTGSTLNIFLPDGSTESFTRNTGTNRITLNSTPVTSSNINVCALAFTELERSTQVTATLKANPCAQTTNNQTFTFTTTIAQRYAP